MQKFKVELEITLEEGGKSALEVLDLYGAQARDDVDQVAWNLCGCDDRVKEGKFIYLELEEWDVKHRRGEDFRGKAVFSVTAQEEAFIRQVFDEYMDGFSDYLRDAENGYYSRTGKRTRIEKLAFSWSIIIK